MCVRCLYYAQIIFPPILWFGLIPAILLLQSSLDDQGERLNQVHATAVHGLLTLIHNKTFTFKGKGQEGYTGPPKSKHKPRHSQAQVEPECTHRRYLTSTS